MSRQVLGVVGVMLVFALGAAWVLMSGVDTGPDVMDAAVPARPELPAAQADPDESWRNAKAPPARQAATVKQPPASPGVVDPMRHFGNLRDMPVKEMALPSDPAERAQYAAERTTERRIEMMGQMFRLAPMVVPEGEDREFTKEVLDGALSEMKSIQSKVQNGMSYKDASASIDGIRNAAIEKLDGYLPEDEAAAVRLRMGSKPKTPDPVVHEWDGRSFEEAFEADWQ